jgi:hypothetical protein
MVDGGLTRRVTLSAATLFQGVRTMLSCRLSRTVARGAGGVIAALLLISGAPSSAVSANDAYRPPDAGYGDDVYRPAPEPEVYRPDESYRPEEPYRPGEGRAEVPPAAGYGEPYSPPGPDDGLPEPKGPSEASVYSQNEIVSAGHQFFGSVSKGLAQAVEWAFQSQGRPNGYILGEDAGGAFVVGLRYGEGMLHTKTVGSHKVFWQGPSVGYDAGAEGSKTMILVYNIRDPNEIFERFGGVQGAAYLVGGVGVQVQKHGNVTLAVIRSGVGLRLGANVGYMKYTRSPTWNPL